MAVRGKYTKAQQKMVDDTNKAADKMVGWAKSPTRMVASEESIKNRIIPFIDTFNENSLIRMNLNKFYEDGSIFPNFYMDLDPAL